MELKSNRRHEDNSSYTNVDNTNITDILKCYICFNKLNNPVMCPHCSKLCCEQCIKVNKMIIYRNGLLSKDLNVLIVEIL